MSGINSNNGLPPQTIEQNQPSQENQDIRFSYDLRAYNLTNHIEQASTRALYSRQPQHNLALDSTMSLETRLLHAQHQAKIGKNLESVLLIISLLDQLTEKYKQLGDFAKATEYCTQYYKVYDIRLCHETILKIQYKSALFFATAPIPYQNASYALNALMGLELTKEVNYDRYLCHRELSVAYGRTGYADCTLSLLDTSLLLLADAYTSGIGVPKNLNAAGFLISSILQKPVVNYTIGALADLPSFAFQVIENSKGIWEIPADYSKDRLATIRLAILSKMIADPKASNKDIYSFFENTEAINPRNNQGALRHDHSLQLMQLTDRLFSTTHLRTDDIEILFKCITKVFEAKLDSPETIQKILQVGQSWIEGLLKIWSPDQPTPDQNTFVGQCIQQLMKLEPLSPTLGQGILQMCFHLLLTMAERLNTDQFDAQKYMPCIECFYKLFDIFPPEKISKETGMRLIEIEKNLINRLTQDISTRTPLELEPIIVCLQGLPTFGSLRLHLSNFRFILANKYADPHSPERNLIKAFGIYRDLLNYNHLGAQFKLGIMYINGEGTLPNPTVGYNHLKSAAELGHPEAVGWMIIQAIKHNDPIAQLTLGHIFQGGVIGAPDMDGAIYYYQMAENQGQNEASYALGELYLKSQNPTEALKHYQLGSDRGNIDCHLVLGNLYCTGDEGIKINNRLALEYYQRLAYTGDAHGQYMAGLIYASGANEDMLGPLYERAVPYLMDAALQGHKEAEFLLSTLYLSNRGVNPNLSENERVSRALSLLNRSSDRGMEKASYRLGRLYQKGKFGIPKDRAKAIVYFKKALDQDHPKAAEKIKLASLLSEEERLD